MRTVKEYNIIFMGAYTKDTIIKDNRKKYVDGGGFNYGVHVAAAMETNVAAITCLSEKDWEIVEKIKKIGVDVYASISDSSTYIVIEYPTSNPDYRRLYVTAIASPFTKEQVSNFKAKAFVISPSLRGEVPLEVIEEIRRNNDFISIDLQGFLRVVDSKGALIYAEWPEKEKVLSLVDVVKADAVEAEFMTKESNIYNSAKIISSYGPKEVVITHRNGLLVYDGKNYYKANFYPRKLVGRSGRGDTAIASYMARRIKNSPGDAAIWAAAATSLKMENEGPFIGNKEDIERLVLKKYTSTKLGK